MSLKPVQDLAEDLAEPKDYLAGFDAEHLIIPREILAFSRTSLEDLYQPALENQSHHRFVLMIPLSGSGTVSLDNTVFRISPGQGMLFFPYQFHYYMDVSPGKITWLFVTFQGVDPKMIATLKDHLFSFGEQEAERLQPFLENYDNGENPHPAELHFFLGRFLHHLLQDAHTDSVVTREEADDPLIGKVNTCVAMASGPGPDIGSIAKELGISESHLRKLFRESYGGSIGRYLHNLQMHRAATWLATTSLTVSEIADRCGYRSPAAFSRSFRIDHGVSPREYRSLREVSGR